MTTDIAKESYEGAQQIEELLLKAASDCNGIRLSIYKAYDIIQDCEPSSKDNDTQLTKLVDLAAELTKLERLIQQESYRWEDEKIHRMVRKTT